MRPGSYLEENGKAHREQVAKPHTCWYNYSSRGNNILSPEEIGDESHAESASQLAAKGAVPRITGRVFQAVDSGLFPEQGEYLLNVGQIDSVIV
jgi:hypothetical protein